VNPSIPEMVNQVCFQVFGCDATILAATEAAQLELNVMMPVIAWNAIHATRILQQAMHVLQDRCVSGIRADADRCRELLDRSTAVATALSPYIGYAATADIAKTAVRTGVPIRELVREQRLLPEERLDRILSAEAMTTPGVPGQNERETGEARTNNAARSSGTARGNKRRRPAQPAVSAGGARSARGTGSRGVAASRRGDGRAANRGGKRGR
jgi:hypothetical protein